MKALKKDIVRCSWPSNELSILYHDREWGVPQHDDRMLFERLILEGAQAGLGWDTILRKRENYRAAFDGFTRRKSRVTTGERRNGCCAMRGSSATG
jgi:3-methyladenine DNA glycosylase Tag